MNELIIDAIVDSLEDGPEVQNKYAAIRDKLQKLLCDSGTIESLICDVQDAVYFGQKQIAQTAFVAGVRIGNIKL